MRFCLCFLFFSGFLGSFLALGAGRRAVPFSVGLFVCCFCFFMKAILSFLDFSVGHFCVRFLFFFSFLLRKRFFHFWIFVSFFVVFYFSFHFCFDLPQVSNCYESDSFIFIFGPFKLFFFSFHFCFDLPQVSKC